jgi:hypothetical protein
MSGYPYRIAFALVILHGESEQTNQMTAQPKIRDLPEGLLGGI